MWTGANLIALAIFGGYYSPSSMLFWKPSPVFSFPSWLLSGWRGLSHNHILLDVKQSRERAACYVLSSAQVPNKRCHHLLKNGSGSRSLCDFRDSVAGGACKKSELRHRLRTIVLSPSRV